MQAVTRKKRITAVDLRARVPAIARALALILLVGGAIFVGVSYYKMRSNTPFRLRSEAPSLSKEIVATTEGYERKITDKGRLSLWLRAARDVTYADGHHELEQVNLQVFPTAGDKPDQIISDRSIYDQKNALLQFSGNVQIDTHDALKVRTDSLQFNQETKIAETAAPVTFERENVSGQSTGALVDNEKKRLELRSAVAVTVLPEALKDPKAKPLKGARAKPVIIHSA
ncbi:MAG TPA: LPS export ABC transporter periplasmic protein LptC, partial [Pyrinomonadaceae bacterium]|nr:LPS export ABC transporter periplasmic protein LptC [Pyrinomonadaceae bacterium]